MEYKQGLDRVGDSTSFPFPIKLEYDSSNIYLTPLWIPETSSVLVAKDKITKQPINLLDANELGNLWLCLEIIEGRHKKYRPPKSQGKNYTGTPKESKHPTRGGNFQLARRYYKNYFQNFFEVGQKYTFPKYKLTHTRGLRVVTSIIEKFDYLDFPGFVYVRGTYRYGKRELSDLKRTGIYSNIVKLEFNIDELK